MYKRQERTDGKFRPLLALRQACPVRNRKTLSFEIKAHDHAQQEFGGRVWKVMPQLLSLIHI